MFPGFCHGIAEPKRHRNTNDKSSRGRCKLCPMILTIDGSQFSPAENAQQALQDAVDKLWQSGGGTLEIPAGIYLMQDALHLRDNVQIIGESGATLQKIPAARSPLSHVAGYGHYEFRVEEPEKFAVGMGVLLADENAGGFYTTSATIVERSGDTFFIDRPFSHDYSPQRGGAVTSVHSLIDAHGTINAGVRSLILDGNYPQNQFELNGCRGAGVFLLQAHRITLEEIEVRHFYGDAVSFQQCTDITVANCHLHHNTGGGLHPGSGSVRYQLLTNRIEDNGGCGIYYCLRTTHSLCSENYIVRNELDGISVGERDTDHRVQYNVVLENGDAGIALRQPVVQSGDRTWLESNTLRGNNKNGNFAELYIAPGLSDICAAGNTIEATHGPAIFIGEHGHNICLVGNTVNGQPHNHCDSTPSDFPETGPEAATLHSIRHLGLKAWP